MPIVKIPFTGALEQGTSDWSLPPAELRVCQNGVYTKRGEIAKRNAFDQYVAVANVTRALTYRDEMAILCSSSGVYQFHTSVAGTHQIQQDTTATYGTPSYARLPEMLSESIHRAGAFGRNYRDGDMCHCAGYLVYAWLEAADPYTMDMGLCIRVQVRHAATDVLVYDRSIIGADYYSDIRLTPAGVAANLALLTYRDATNNGIYGRAVTASNSPSIGNAIEIAATGSYAGGATHDTPGPNYDVCSRTSGGWYVTYASTINADPYLAIVTTGGAVSGYDIANTGTVPTLGIGEHSAKVFVAYHDSDAPDNLYINAYNDSGVAQDTAQVLGTFTAAATNAGVSIAATSTANKVIAVWMQDDSSPSYAYDYPADVTATNIPTLYWRTYTVGAGTSNIWKLPGFSAVSKAWLYDGSNYVWAADFRGRTLYLLCLPTDGRTPVRVVTTASYGSAWARPEGKLYTISSNAAGDTYHSLSCAFLQALSGDEPNAPDEDIITGLREHRVDCSTQDMWQGAELDGLLYVSGGVLMQYDGTHLIENHFAQAPWLDATVDAVSSYDFPDGYYQYIVTFDYLDHKGKRHRSVPSNVATVEATVAADQVKLAFGINTLSSRPFGSVGISIYRTEANGTIFHRLARFEHYTKAGGDGIAYDDFSTTNLGLVSATSSYSGTYNLAAYVIVDRTPDTELITHEILYSPPDGSGVLPNDHPWGGVRHLARHKSRLFMASAESPTKLLYTKEAEGGVPVSYSLGQEIEIGEKITGLASNGDALAVFTQNQTYLVIGIGPDATGNPNSGSFEVVPVRANGIGCINSRSIQSIKVGTLFQSARGLYLLDTGGQLTAIGTKVQDALDGETTVYDSVHVPAESQVLWLTNESDNILCLDYKLIDDGQIRFATWDVRWDSLVTLGCVPNGQAFALNSTDLYLQGGDYAENDMTSVPLVVETGNLDFGEGGMVRLRGIEVLGTASDAGYLLYVQNMQASSFGTPESFTDPTTAWGDALTGNVATPVYQLGRSFRIRVSDTSASGGYCVLAGLACEVEPATQRLLKGFKWA